MLSLQRQEGIGDGLTRIARETVDRASEHLADSKMDMATRVHETRKRFKEIRAVLRLGRFAPRIDFKAKNRWFRDAARDLATMREADALIAILGALHGTARDRAERTALTRVGKMLTADRDAVPPGPANDIAERLSTMRDTLTFEGWRWFEPGLRRAYRDGRRAFRAARRAHTPAAIHEWRKRVKDLWYHAQIVAPAWPELMNAHAAMLHELSRLLGEHHDLSALAAMIGEQRLRFGPKTSQRIESVIERRRAEIEASIFRIGPFVFTERPNGWSRRIVRYWRAWTERL